ncbi:unnamed protein product [Brassica rapa]|uniref:Uncharacterized protein n=1 Tax=Brassica campestris TaxID=3711 RepID=A0A8D9GZS0_BRACM|nr:unnamed protein product [Brassica rapa]
MPRPNPHLVFQLTQPCLIYLDLHLRQTSSSLVSISDTDLELSHFHLTQPQALSSPYLELSHLHLLDLSHLHLISRPRALSSLMQHELSLLL